MSQNMSAAEFMQKGTKAGYPSVVFEQQGALFGGTVIGDPEVVWTKDDEDDAEKTPKLVVNVRCTVAQGYVTTTIKTPGVGEQKVLPTVGEMYSVWLKQRTSMIRATNDAVLAQGVASGVPEDQGVIVWQLTGFGERTNPKYSPPKLYISQYQAAPKNIAAANLLGMQTATVAAPVPAPQQFVPAPAPQYAPQPQPQPQFIQQPQPQFIQQPVAPAPAPAQQPNLLG